MYFFKRIIYYILSRWSWCYTIEMI